MSRASKFVPVHVATPFNSTKFFWLCTAKEAGMRKTTILFWVVIGEQFLVVVLWCRRSPQLPKVCGRAVVVCACQRYSIDSRGEVETAHVAIHLYGPET